MRVATRFTRNRKRWSKEGQAEIVFGKPRTWGGRRKGAGRKPKGVRAGVGHLTRESFDGARHPVQVTLRVVPEASGLRNESLRRTIFEGIRAANALGRIRITDFSILGNHLHLIVEAASREALSRGMQGLEIRLAKAINRVLGRSGKVFADRFHSSAKKTPTELRRALLYTLCNHRKHLAESGSTMANDWIDPCSSGPWFEGWRNPPAEPVETSPAAAPGTWLRRAGWLRAGPTFRIYDTPGPAPEY
jgi:hypothetical protein